VLGVSVDAGENTASVVVPDRQLSLAIGKEGQNARLAAKLTGWRIDIRSESIAQQERAAGAVAEAEKVIEEAPAPKAAKPSRTRKAEPVAVAAEDEVILPPEEEAALAFVEVEEPPEVAAEKPAEPEPVAAVVEEPRKPSIRFAEEILTTATVEAPAKGKKAKAGKGSRAIKEEPETEAPAKVKKGKKARRPVIEEEDEDLDEYLP
jgi:N utilization substance protein A